MSKLTNQANHFFIVGGQRCGTSLLCQILDRHPQIQMARPFRPEPKYFLRENYSSGEYVQAFFKPSKEVKWYGEKSTSYHESPSAASRIQSTFPDAKIIFIFRNPVDRALSNYYFSKFHGIESRSLHEAFIDESPLEIPNRERFSTDPVNYIGRGLYHRYVEQYLEVFDLDQIQILIFEELVSNTLELDYLCEWLDLEQSVEFDQTSKVNAVERSEESNEELVVREKLLNYYAESNNLLEELIERDLSPWNSLKTINE